MALKGAEKKAENYAAKKVGVSEFTVVAVNPEKEEIATLTGYADAKEETYLKENTDGIPQVAIHIYLKDVNDGAIVKARFQITKKENVNKTGTKKQFINKIGNTAWAENKDAFKNMINDGSLSEGYRNSLKAFVKREFRAAYQGEDRLYSFIQKYSNLDLRDSETEISYPLADLFKGNFKELRKDLLSIKGRVTGVYEIVAKITEEHVDEQSGEVVPKSAKFYQGIYGEFLEKGFSEYFNGNTGSSYIDKVIKNFKEKVSGEHGSKNFFVLGPVRDFVPSEHPFNKQTSLHLSEGQQMGEEGTVDDSDLPF